MEWNTGTNRDMVKRIVALLFALAELADRASLASRPIRHRVLAMLLPAEAVAQAFAIGMARDLGAPMSPQACLTIGTQMCAAEGGDHGDDPADATRLALRLRVLALALVGLSAWAERFAGSVPGHIATSSEIEVPRKLGDLTGYRRQNIPAPDTS